MASNNPQQQQQQQQQQQHHPLPPPPAGTSGSSFGSGGGSSTGHGGIGRSAPIRTLPAPGPPSLTVPSLPGGMGTPPLVKSKLALTPGRVVGAGRSGGGGKSLPAAVEAAAGRPPSKLPPSIPPPQQQQQHRHQPQVMPPPLPQQPPPLQYYQQTNDDNYAPSTPVTNDPISSSRKTNIADPAAAAASRQTLGQSPGIAAATAPGGSVAGRGGADAPQRQPHIVSLPPPTQTAFHPLDVGAGGTNQQQQQQQNYGVYSHQSAAAGQHPLKQPPASAPSFKQPPQQTSSQALPQTTSSSSSPAKRQPPRTNKPPSTPDEEVDAFLRGPATAASSTSNNKVRKLRPSPLPPSQTKLQKTKILAYRRAWGDVIRVTNDALLGKEGGGVHHCCYSELAAAAASAASAAASSSNAGASGGAGGSLVPDASAVATGKELEKLRRETSEMLALRFISQLKLRRYADLGKEVQHLGLLPFLPDHAGFPTLAISGLDAGAHDLVKDGSSSLPSSPGTTVTEASIDMLSSSPVKKSKQPSNGGSSSNNNDKYMAWKEGSLHSTHPSDPLPSWVPFGLRILAAHQLQYNDGASKSIDVLYDLRDRTIRTDHWGTAGMEIWRGVIDVALVNAFVRKREWRLALRGLEELMGGLEGGVLREVHWWCSHGGSSNVNDVGATVGEEERKVLAEAITAAAHVELLSRQILILLQSGAISAAETIQNAVRLHAAEVQSLLNPAAMTTTLLRVANELALVRQASLRQKVNEGLLLFARCQYTDACQHFRDALAQQRELDSAAVARQSQPAGCPTWKDLSSPTLGFDAEPSLTVECLNNLSLCLLYAGNMRSSVQELEGLTREDPCRYLTEGMAFNLCTLYELGSDGEECTKKKKLLQRVAKRFYLHDVGVESFRLG